MKKFQEKYEKISMKFLEKFGELGRQQLSIVCKF